MVQYSHVHVDVNLRRSTLNTSTQSLNKPKDVGHNGLGIYFDMTMRSAGGTTAKGGKIAT